MADEKKQLQAQVQQLQAELKKNEGKLKDYEKQLDKREASLPTQTTRAGTLKSAGTGNGREADTSTSSG